MANAGAAKLHIIRYTQENTVSEMHKYTCHTPFKFKEDEEYVKHVANPLKHFKLHKIIKYT